MISAQTEESPNEAPVPEVNKHHILRHLKTYVLKMGRTLKNKNILLKNEIIVNKISPQSCLKLLLFLFIS